MANTGRLTNVEKMAIQGGLSRGDSVKSIAEAIDRSPKTVKRYIDRKLKEIHETVLNAQIERAESTETPTDYAPVTESEVEPVPEEETIRTEDVAKREIVVATFKQLRNAGLTEHDANKIIHSALVHAAQNGAVFKTESKLYAACINRMSAGHFIQKQTEAGNEGVAIMSQAASQRMDEAKKSYNTEGVSRAARGNVYNPSRDEYM